MTLTKVGIIVLNWNGKKDTLECLDSLSRLNRRGIDVHISVVDNGSKDDSVEIIGNKFPLVEIIALPENIGFAAGNNVGIAHWMKLRCEYVWILNNDTIVAPSALSALLDAYNDPSVGIAGSKIYFAKGREFHHDRYTQAQRGHVLWYAGGIIDWNNLYGFHRGVDEVDHGQYNEEIDTDYVSGCSMMLSKEVIDAGAHFDERYYSYYEDLELSVRIKTRGYRVVYIPKSCVWHKNAGSTGRPGNVFHQYYITRNRFLFGMTYAPLKTRLALMRQAFATLRHGTATERKAVIDSVLGRYGGQFVWNKTETFPS